ncbi:hypothetical protein KBB96_10625 [Luteolibacter ambystomatis]|uniref:Uncharacterized protein n=1 Tax=Luteolibacter ambystomatis TaxID=2824561 RepID=A0A975G5V5_9BACT|nr:hypothetical protein [Luteolibacter ambystomatis]QUE49326.1 hypothetical protein KBB96_10625 [Luteolibacter ambystomatis]
MAASLTACRRFLAIVLLWGGVSSALAHQPYESSARARLDGDGVELVITTSLEIAGLLAGEPLADAAVLERMATERVVLYEASADGRKLDPQRVFAAIRNNEAVFSMVYPVERPSGLSFRAVYLNKLPPGYGGSLEVVDAAGHVLGLNPLLKRGEGRDTLDIRTPVPLAERAAPAAAIVSVPTTAPGIPSSTPAQQGPRWLPAVIGIIALVILLVLSLQQFRHS